MTNTPSVFFMCGLPCSGKTHFVDQWMNNSYSPLTNDPYPYIISTDITILSICDLFGVNYSDYFKDLIGFADKVMYHDLTNALNARADIFWDQTNLTKKSRAKKLAKFDDTGYNKEIFFFDTPWEVIQERMKAREEWDVIVPDDVMERMRDSFEMPTLDEGWDAVHIIDYNPNLNPEDIGVLSGD